MPIDEDVVPGQSGHASHHNQLATKANELDTLVTSGRLSESGLNTTIGAELDAAAVKLTGAQTVAGVKTFSSAPVVPNGSFSIAKTTGLQAALDDKLSDTDTLYTDRDNGQPGIYAPSGGLSGYTDGQIPSGDQCFARFVPSRAMTARAIAFRVTTVAGSGNDDPVRVGIVSATGVVLVDSGSVTGRLNTTGVKTITIADTALVAGQTYYAYYLTVAAGTPAALRRTSFEAALFGSGFGLAEAGRATGKTMTVETPVTGFTVNGAVPLLAVREFAG